MHLFHKWSRWEEYEWHGVVYPGILSPKEIRGKEIEVVQIWQKRKCEKCGLTQRIEVTD